MRRRRPAHQLRVAIDCMPLESRHAMLEALGANRIIVGAYVDRQGGVCPMLAAHRNGGRTSLASFARAWDRYTRAGHGPRPATERELRTLRTMLESSIAIEQNLGSSGLAEAIAEHQAAQGAPPRPRVDTGERNRTPELRKRPGWSWLRPFRRYDEYEEALRELEAVERERRLLERERELV